jgi:hypothetical protein
MQIMKETGLDWRERNLISKLRMDHCVKYDWTEWRQEV